MKKSEIPKPLLSTGWLRALLYTIAIALTAGISIGLYILLQPKSQSGVQILQNLPLGSGILLVFVLSLLITFIFRRWIDRKSFVSLGLNIHGHFQNALAGGMLAIFIICTSSLLLKFTGHLKWMDIIFDPKAIFIAFGSIVLIAITEELIFRGYILNNLLDSFPKWLALLISALLFMIVHWTTVGFFPMVNTLVIGIILGLNYIYTRNLWFSICFHIGWKFLEGPILGFPGAESFQTLLQPEIQGDENITGSVNGLEGSFILLTISLLSLLALYLFMQKKLNPRSQPVPGQI